MKKIALFLLVSCLLFSCGQKEIDQTISQELEVIADTDRQADENPFIRGDAFEDDELDTSESEEDMNARVDEEVDQEWEDTNNYDWVYSAQLDQSIVQWSGSKIVWGSHEWIINIQSGEIIIQDNTFVSGFVVIDMQTISSTDLEGKSKEGLDKHLKEEDFFDVLNHPTASIEVTWVQPISEDTYTFTSNMTILWVTNPEEFVGSVFNTDNTITLQTSIILNKDDYGIASGFKWAALKDEIPLEIVVTFER